MTIERESFSDEKRKIKELLKTRQFEIRAKANEIERVLNSERSKKRVSAMSSS